ncbi:ZP domain-containing protein [Aphelenchoides bicaudatus]|nr:ZP domain-containing protein [Aphelenchoides bicaudatus]
MPTILPFLSFPFNCILLFTLLFITSGAAQDVGTTAVLIGSPRVRCKESTISVTLTTSEQFEGNVYAKGFFDKENCRVQGDSSGNTANITIPINADCGMRRRRIINPKGIVLEMTMVLMLHPRFLTKNDQAFNIKCTYVEISQKFTNHLEVSMLPSTEVPNNHVDSLSIEAEGNLPKCKYEVLNEERKPLLFATIGQVIVHRWSCSSDEEEEDASTNYCLNVHTCIVDDGHGNEQKLLDYNGCPVDKSLMDQIQYESDLQAVRKSNVFKFADRPTVYFSCQLRLELKSDFDGQCNRVKCPPPAPSLKSSAEKFARTSLSYDPDFPRPRVTVASPVEQSDEIIRNDQLPIPKKLPNAEDDIEPSQPNDSFEISHLARHASRTQTNHNPHEFDFDTDGIPLVSPSSPLSKNATKSLNTLEPNKEEEKFVTRLPRITVGTPEKQEDVPLPTIAPLNPESIQRIRLSTPEPEESESEERANKLASVESKQKAVEIDVNTPLSVLDLPSLDSDELLSSTVHKQRNIVDMMTSRQVCVSRQALSAFILASAIILLLLALVLGTVLWKFVRRPRVVVMARDPYADLHHHHADRRVLSAFHA